MTAIFTGAAQVTRLAAIFLSFASLLVPLRFSEMWCIAEAAASCNRRALARFYSRYNTHEVPEQALYAQSATEGRASGPVGGEKVSGQGQVPVDPPKLKEVPPQGLTLSLPPVSLPKALEQAVNRVLASEQLQCHFLTVLCTCRSIKTITL